jgi:deoxyribodipyrimidine photo-lyase
MPVFIFDTRILDHLQDRDDRRVTFSHASLAELDAKLREHGSQLIVRHGDPERIIPELAQQWRASLVVAARDYEPYAIARDAAVAASLTAQGCELRLVKDHVGMEPDALKSQSGEPFSVYTPYSKAWKTAFRPEFANEHHPSPGRLAPQESLKPFAWDWPLERIGFCPAELSIAPGESAAKAALHQFGNVIRQYGELRNFPAAGSTSILSPHLRFGTISIRACFRLALQSQSSGAQTWLDELIWRDFYQHVMFHWPHAAERAFRREYDSIVWPGEASHFERWRDGQTGYPLVDAAMRCLRATGWMHNRLRMVAASFLVKDLLVDYKLGEAHFARYLLDFELASNNGGWQWTAGTGCDAQPYFRIFNPILQSRKFDPEGKFIRTWCAELRSFSADRIHAPWEAPIFEQMEVGCVIGVDYPEPIVQHEVQRALAIRLLESAKESAKATLR